MAITKKEALSIAFACAARYKNYLIGRDLLFVCMDKHKHIYRLEVSFNTSNFQHMTGFKTNPNVINSLHFFKLCYDKRLTESDFEFSDDGTTSLKMKALPRLITKNLSARMVGDYNSSQPKLYTEKLVGGVNACVGFIRDGGEGKYVPNTVLECDMRQMTACPDRILLTYRKWQGSPKYSELEYKASGVDWSVLEFPPELHELISLSLPNSDGTQEV